MTSAAINGVKGTSLPLIHHVCEVTSTLDLAQELAEKDVLGEWDSVLAKSQTRGRGQMRRDWVSPAGNLYAALRLPQLAPFNAEPAAIAVGAVLAQALSSFGCRIMLKWPNDLIFCQGSKLAKLGGILLEEKHGVILAGIGINVLYAPPRLDNWGEYRAGSLVQACPEELPGPGELWQALVKHLHSVYKNGAFFTRIWRDLAEERLLWRGEQVELSDGDDSASGIFVGINDMGCALLSHNGVITEKSSGSMRPAARAGV